jgi:hypothetical protein
MSNDPRHPTRREEFLREINQMLDNSPYQDNPNLHRLYCMGLLRELLLYSGVDMMEIREHVRYLGQRGKN